MNTGKCGAGNGMRNFPSPEATINHRQAPGHISIYELLAELIFSQLAKGCDFGLGLVDFNRVFHYFMRLCIFGSQLMSN